MDGRLAVHFFVSTHLGVEAGIGSGSGSGSGGE